MSALFSRLHLYLARHRILALLLVAGFVALAVGLGRQVVLDDDFTRMLPLSDPAIARQVAALKHVRQADRLYFDIQTATTDPERLALAADQWQAVLRQIPELKDIRDQLTGAELGAVYDQLRAELPTLLSADELRQLEARLSAEAIAKRLAWLKQAMSQPQGMMLKTVTLNDPVGLSDPVAQRLRLMQLGAGDAGLVAGRITSSDGRHVLISAAPVFRPVELKKSEPLLARLLASAREVEARHPPGAIRIAITGAHRVTLDNANLIRRDSTVTSIIAGVGVVLLMVVAFRRRWLALLGMLPPLFGSLGALLAFYLVGDPVCAAALGFGGMLIGMTVDYGIYVLYLSDDTPPANREEFGRMLARLAPSVIMGALTTMLAFAVMFASPVSGHQQLGLFGLAGVAAAALFALTILPLLIPIQSVRGPGTLPLSSAIQFLLDLRSRHSGLVWLLVVGLSVAAAMGGWRLRFEGDFARLNGVSPATQKDEETVRRVWEKSLALTIVVVRGSDPESVLQKNEQVSALLARLSGHGELAYSSLAPVVPSERTRRANGQAWSAFWTDPRRAELSNSLAAATSQLGFRANVFQPFLDSVATGPSALLARKASMAQRIPPLFDDYWLERDGQFAVSTLVKVKDRAQFLQLQAAVLQELPDALLLNKAAMGDEIARVAKQALPIFTVIVLVLNGALLFLLLGRLELVCITLLPIVTGVGWTLGAFGWLGMPVDMSNFIFVTFVVGVSGDYSLFLVLAELETLRGHKDHTAATGGAVMVCALTTLVGIGVLVLARHPALNSVGWAGLLGIGLSLLATLLLVPACMAWLRRREAAHTATIPSQTVASPPALRRMISRLYRYHGPYPSQFVYWKLRTDPLFPAVNQATPRQGLILDLGCGYGLVAHWLTLSAPDRTVLGVDHDAGKIQIARSTMTSQPRVTFECQDLLRWEYPPCDHVLLCDVLHYLPRELKQRVLQQAFAAMRPGGSLILRDAAGADACSHRLVVWTERLGVRLGQNRTNHGLHFESAAEYQQLLASAGFKQVQLLNHSGLGSNVLLTARK